MILLFNSIESRCAKLECLLRLEYWLQTRMYGGDRAAKLEYLELKITLDKRNVAAMSPRYSVDTQ